MIIILEGENKTGKTTLAKYLSRNLKFKYFKFSQPKIDPYVEYLDFALKNNSNVIVDRFHWGEMVYGKIYRGKSMLSSEKFRNIELELLAKNAIVIYCYDELDNIKNRFKSENEEWAKAQKIEEVLHEYNKTLNTSILPIYFHQLKTKFDLTNTDDFLIKIQELVKNNNYFGGLIGNSNNPKLLLVGDKHNDNQRFKFNKKYNSVKIPFDFGNSSKALYHVLEKAKIPLTSIAIINSDNNQLSKILKKLKYEEVVALGKKASNVLSKIKINHITVNHPGYEKRFFNVSTSYVTKFKRIYENSK